MEIKTFSPENHKIKALIYGPSGHGKTSFGGTAKNVLFASAENGLLSVADKQVAYTTITSLEDLEELYTLLKGKHDFETLCIDSITEINDIIKAGIEKRTGKRMQLQDWGELSNHIERIIKDIKGLDMNVIVIAQELNVQDDNKIQRIVPSLNGKSSTKICYYMDIVGYMYIDKSGKRTIITNANEKFLTKDRTGKIGNDTTLDFEEWKKLVATLKVGEEKVLFKTMTGDELKQAKFEEFFHKLTGVENMDQLKEVFGELYKIRTQLAMEKYKELEQLKDSLKNGFLNPKKKEKKETKKTTKKTKKK